MRTDFDPEEEPVDQDDSDDVSGEETDENAARDHYVDVGKSKLRKRDQVPLGPRYEGSSISRNAALDEEEDDPFSRGFEDEGSEEEEERSDQAEEDIDGEDGEAPQDDDDASDVDEKEDEDMLDGDSTSATDVSYEDNEEDGMKASMEDNAEERAELRRMMAEEQKSVAASLSQAARADAEKGRAVKRQRRTFDDLLNTRIKLQKALVGVNTLSGLAQETQEESAEYSDSAFQAAETAAFSLWTSLTTLRESLQNGPTSKKRTHSTFAADTPTADLWTHTQSLTRTSQSNLDSILQKWSAKSRGVSAIAPRNRLTNTTSQTTITDILREQTTNSSHLIERARVPRSCAPLQLSQKLVSDPHIYDDADFYSVLLTALLEQRSADSMTAASAAAGVNINGYQSRREAKTKKVVDTKASKGRKLRYTVHEKLENYMAPEDRGAWGERQADELFGSLFGARMGLGEDDGVDGGDGHDEQDDDDAEAGLMLFRS